MPSVIEIRAKLLTETFDLAAKARQVDVSMSAAAEETGRSEGIQR